MALFFLFLKIKITKNNIIDEFQNYDYRRNVTIRSVKFKKLLKYFPLELILSIMHCATQYSTNNIIENIIAPLHIIIINSM